MEDWEAEAKKQQEFFYNIFCDRNFDEISVKGTEEFGNNTKYTYLQQKVLFGMYGQLSSNQESYDEIQIQNAAKICDALIYQNDKFNKHLFENIIYLSVVYVTGVQEKEEQFCIPVFRIWCCPKDEISQTQKADAEVVIECFLESARYVDTEGRVYKSWNNFLMENDYPPCEYIYPKIGYYKLGDFELTKGESPASGVGHKVVDVLDKASAVSIAVGVGISLLSLAVPVFAPIVIAGQVATMGSAAYGGVRSVCTIVDRRTHKQTINPIKDKTMCLHWLGLAGVAVGFARFGTLVYIERASRLGKVVGKVASGTLNGITAASVTINSLNVAMQFGELFEKGKKKEITAIDIANCCMSVFFFANEVISIKTARTIITEMQDNEIANYRKDLSSKERRKFARIKKRYMYKSRKRGYGEETGKAKTIKRMGNVAKFSDIFKQTYSGPQLSEGTSFASTPMRNMDDDDEESNHSGSSGSADEDGNKVDFHEIFNNSTPNESNELSLDDILTIIRLQEEDNANQS